MDDNNAYGHKRVAWALDINHKRSGRVMKLFGLKPQRRRKPPFRPKDQNQAPMAVPNLIQGIIVEAPNKVWVSDFTYLPYFGGFVYLATLEDIFTRRVVGWSVSIRHNTELIAEALLNGLLNNPAPKIHHSDQGNEYRSDYYLNLLKSFSIKPSMSEKASPWQNGYKESFYSEFKLELGHPECYSTLGELIEAIARQIYYYNNKRIHSALKCPPAVFAQRIASGHSIKSGKKSVLVKPAKKQAPVMPQDKPQKSEMTFDTFKPAEKQKSSHSIFQEIAEVQSV